MSIKKLNQGFTLIEILVSITIMMVISLGLMGMQSGFSKSMVSREITTILNDVANNQLNRCKLGLSIESPYIYDMGTNRKINIYSTATCTTPTTDNTCENINVTSTTANITGLSGTQLDNLLNKSRKVKVHSIVCKFN